jgi:hypothetical protein
MKLLALAWGWIYCAAAMGASVKEVPAPAPQAFRQELSRHFTADPGAPQGPVSLIVAGPDGSVQAYGQGTWYQYQKGRWQSFAAVPQGPRDLFSFPDAEGKWITADVARSSVVQVLPMGQGFLVVSTHRLDRWESGKWTREPWPESWTLAQVAVTRDGEWWAASSHGLVRRTASGWEPESIVDAGDRAWAVRSVLGVAVDASGQLWFASKAGVGCRTPKGWRFFEGKDGLPWNEFTGIAAGLAGEVWFTTSRGVIRWNGTEFQYRQGPRWLPSDAVSQASVQADGRAWFATSNGVGYIDQQPMTLAQKAERYEREIDQYIRRTSYGFTAEAPLKTPGDRATAAPEDSDNDGLWTAMYGAGECFAYAATRDPKAKARATRAFEALRFLQKVTQGGTPAPPKGYVARTVRPVEWPDPNAGRIEGDREEAKRDGLWKVYEPRWPKSADGQWYWKSDTSSDELDGHFFFHAAYFEHVAETPEEKDRCREVVRDLADHLVSHGFNLVDIDGKPTRWGQFGPESVNRDERWVAERGLNSLSILSYLAVAGYVTGDPKYTEASRELVNRHGYAQNLMFPKVQFGPGSGNHSDDEMAVMCFYNLLRYGKDPAIQDRVRYASYAYWAMEAPEQNPFFNFAFAAEALGKTIRNVWGEFSVHPWAGWHEDALATLRGFPLDRLNWPHQNSHRLDIVRLSRQQAKDLYDPRDEGRGHRVNGKVLPVENRHFEHWNTDPWVLDYGGSGNILGSGTVFLLPYYLGLYHGFIEKPR